MTITLDVRMVQALKKGESIIVKKYSKPKMKQGYILGVKETWQLDSHYQPVYKADTDLGIGVAPSDLWNYATNMPERHIRLYAEVVSVEKITQREFLNRYGKCVAYNKSLFYYNGCKYHTNESFSYDDEVYAVTLSLYNKEEMTNE